MSERRGTCSTCHRADTYVFVSGLCMLCEDKRLIAAGDLEALAEFREYVREVAFG